MEQQELNDYRDQLLSSLEEHPSRTQEVRQGSLQIFVNHECVGSVDCMKCDSNYSFSSRDRSVHTVELRNEAGVLVVVCARRKPGSKIYESRSSVDGSIFIYTIESTEAPSGCTSRTTARGGVDLALSQHGDLLQVRTP